ncbi:phosphoribosyltransferase [Helicobacter sp. MIT 21-1697]|uniref:ComF family protein n=1 Tax=Helicobacter sp. MIT 21-1697 TaxID=2993733 RepID=UPI00224A54C5|nr:phosphoribosyltransferase [Helicobacter sp. MIT 21-1697]MCX2717854.1 phosphoribosyltransferase [Helicobacter sp. MIT 21-1697]
MKCLVCEKWSFSLICKECLAHIPLTPRYRILQDSIKVYSFYRYEDVTFLMQSKYHLVGSRILCLLAKRAAEYFFTHFSSYGFTNSSFPIALVGLDDYPYGAYSHVGVIAKVFSKESKGIFKAHFGVLKAQNQVKYAGKNLAFRQDNPKGFMYKPSFAQNVDIQSRGCVLLDDIITTGTSLNEAISALKGFKIHFCLALCDAKD